MKIKVSHNPPLYIVSDRYGYAIAKPITRKRNGEEVEELEQFAWFATLTGAANGLADYALRTSDAQTVAEALEEVKRISAALCGALRPTFEVRLKEGGGAC